MNLTSVFSDIYFNRNMTRLKLVLLLSFSILIMFQCLIGFRVFEDYLVIFIFILFLNDLYFKIKRPQTVLFQKERIKRLIMSAVFLGLFLIQFIFDSANISNTTRVTLYKLFFVLWAQVFLIDTYLHYRQTHSKQWLVFANLAMLMIIVGAFAG